MMKDEYLTKGFSGCLLFSFILLWAVLSYAAEMAYMQVSFEEAQQLQTILVTRQLTYHGVFFNNLALSGSLTIPLIGIFPFIYVWYHTGWSVGVLSVAYKTPPQPLILKAMVFLFPEILAYGIMLAENIYVSMKVFKRFNEALKRLKAHYWKSAALYVTSLFIGALLETWMLQG